MPYGQMPMLNTANGTTGGGNVISVAVSLGATANDLVAGVATKQIKVLSWVLTSLVADHTVQFEDGATDYTGVMNVGVAPNIAPFNEAGWFTVTVSLGLDFTTSGTTPLITGVLTYILV